MEQIKTIDDVEVEIRRAILVLNSLPKEGPKPLSAFWPEYKTDPENDKTSKFTPFPDEIDDMYYIFENWFKLLDIEQRLLVYKRNDGKNWKALCHEFNMSRSNLNNIYRKALKTIFQFELKQQAANNARTMRADGRYQK